MLAAVMEVELEPLVLVVVVVISGKCGTALVLRGLGW